MSKEASHRSGTPARKLTPAERRWRGDGSGIGFRLKSKGKTWGYWAEDLKRYVACGSTRAEAIAAQAEYRLRKSRGERVVRPSRRTVAEVAEAWFAAEKSNWRPGYAAAMRQSLDNEILKEFGSWKIAAVGPADVIAYDRKLRARGLSESGAANICKAFRGPCDYAVLCGDISVSPYRQVPRGKLSSSNTRREHHEWRTDEIETFIAKAHEHDLRPEARRGYGDLIEFLVRSGTRIAEATGIRFRDIDRDERVVHVRGQWTKFGNYVSYTKTSSSERRVPLTDDMLATFDFRASYYGLGPDDYVFAVKAGGTPPSHTNFRKRGWGRVVAATGLKLAEGVRVTPHDARHAAASQLADLNLDSDDAAALLGHSSAKVTEGIYTHAFNRDAREARIRAAMNAAQNGSSSEDA